MKCITNFFPKASLSKLFFCFADPHFKVPAGPRTQQNPLLCTRFLALSC